MDPSRTKVAIDRFAAFFRELQGVFVEREEVLQQVALALLSREHMLMTGPPGTAKSLLATAALKRIIDEQTGEPSLFAHQFTENTVQTDLIGPIDFKTLTDTGRTEHFTDEGMLGAVHAFLDEVFDGRDMLLRSTLNVLNERELKQGARITRGAIECAVMTTNRYLAEVLEQSRENLLAFVDRIAYLSFVPKGFASPEGLARVLKSQVATRHRHELRALLTVQDLDALQALTETVRVSESACERLVQLLGAFEVELHQAAKADPSFVPTRYLSTRTAVRLGRALRAICVFDRIFRSPDRKLDVVSQDFEHLRLCLLLSGPTREHCDVLLRTEPDPRERRQLRILLMERDIFDRCLKALPEMRAEPVRPAAIRVEGGHEWTDKSQSQLLTLTAELLGAAQEGVPDAESALDKTLEELSHRAYEAGLSAGADGSEQLLETAKRLHELADNLEQADMRGRSLGCWLRDRALSLVDAALSLAPESPRISINVGDSEIAPPEAQEWAATRLRQVARIAELRGSLIAQGTSASSRTESDATWNGAIAHLESELALIWDIGFRSAVRSALGSAPAGGLPDVLAALQPTLQSLNECGALVGELGGDASSLKRRVVGPRIAPLVEATFARFDARDRFRVAEQVDQVIGLLASAGLEHAILPEQLLTWTARALLRSESGTGATAEIRPDHQGYVSLRLAQQRVSLTYVLIEVGLRLLPQPMLAPEPTLVFDHIRSALGGLPAELRQAIVESDLARVERPLDLLERWWAELSRGAASAENAESALRSLSASRFFEIIAGEAALARFKLDCELTCEVLPEATLRVRHCQERMQKLATEADALSTRLVSERSSSEWNRILTTPTGA